MSFENFPQYRRLSNGMSFYEITGPSRMREIQVIGKYWMEHMMEARILPERNHIGDLLDLKFPGVEAINEETFREHERHCREERIHRTL